MEEKRHADNSKRGEAEHKYGWKMNNKHDEGGIIKKLHHHCRINEMN